MHTLWNVSSCRNAQQTYTFRWAPFFLQQFTDKSWLSQKSNSHLRKNTFFYPHTYTIVISQLYCFQSMLASRLWSAMHYSSASMFFSISHNSKNHFSRNNSGPSLQHTFTATASTKQQMASFWKKKQTLWISVKTIAVSFSKWTLTAKVTILAQIKQKQHYETAPRTNTKKRRQQDSVLRTTSCPYMQCVSSTQSSFTCVSASSCCFLLFVLLFGAVSSCYHSSLPSCPYFCSNIKMFALAMKWERVDVA